MRLAQIARKVGMTPTDIKRFLQSEFELNIGNEPNYKLDDKQVDAVLEKFPIPEPPKVETAVKEVAVAEEEEIPEASIEGLDHAVEEINAIEEEATSTEEVVEIVEEIASEEEINEEAEEEEEKADESTTEEIIESSQEVEAVAINYDDPAEESEDDAFVEVPVDRNADLIKAPQVKLDGLKVLGKIELPEKKKIEPEVTKEELEQEEADAIAQLEAAMQSQSQDIKAGKVDQPKAKAIKENIAEEEEFSEYKDRRGIYHFSPQQKANRAKALVQLEIKRKAQAEKEKKKRHYEELMQAKKEKESSKATKIKEKKTQVTKEKKAKKEKKEAPKGLWAKFVHWLND